MSDNHPIKWHGGKHYLASRIIERIPPHTHYVEPFFGGGSVLFAKPDEMVIGHSEAIGDINSSLTNFWRVLQLDDEFVRFKRIVESMPFSQTEWEESLEPTDDPVLRAVRFFVQYRQSRQGLGKCFATMSRSRTRRGMNEQVSSWLSAVDGLESAHSRLMRVVIFNDDAVRIIQREDSPSTFFYLDPPYAHETRVAKSAYEHEMTMEDHSRLLEMLSSISGKFLLSGYPSELYDKFAGNNGWMREDFTIDNKASGSKTKPVKTECLWRNFA